MLIRRGPHSARVALRHSPHSMRHTSITSALEAGASLRDVQDFARHATRARPAATTGPGTTTTANPPMPSPPISPTPTTGRKRISSERAGRVAAVQPDSTPVGQNEQPAGLAPMTGEVQPAGYIQLLDAVKREVAASRTQAARVVNAELIGMYWRIGRLILDRQADEGWGARVIDRLATDLRTALPGGRGFSRRNLHYMRAIAEALPAEIVQQTAAQLPWGQLMVLLDKVGDPARSHLQRQPRLGAAVHSSSLLFVIGHSWIVAGREATHQRLCLQNRCSRLYGANAALRHRARLGGRRYRRVPSATSRIRSR